LRAINAQRPPTVGTVFEADEIPEFDETGLEDRSRLIARLDYVIFPGCDGSRT
jgi:hypothetical protein